MNGKIFDFLKAAFGLVSSDITTERTSAYVSLADARRVAAVVLADNVPANQTVTIQFVEATDSSGTGAQNVGDAVTVSAGESAEDLVKTAEIKTEELSDGFTHVAVKVKCSSPGSPNVAVPGAVALIQGENRFQP